MGFESFLFNTTSIFGTHVDQCVLAELQSYLYPHGLTYIAIIRNHISVEQPV